ncbi:PilN domain-containing protein [Oceanimonas sp. CAM02]|uniref:PilN domain-containing protein n=1 Tax=Oceanimonas sp. CAM02 TaxID=3080336 RepID=UPI0029355976|nr:PilN domain-containing protein [Oceanimonas sp. CAM02]MDV2858621.1 fimbrial assembly protein [Oceanimonas sp. CAM02]
MKTRIEFYQAALKPVKELPTSRHVLLGMLAVVLLWGLVFAWQSVTNHRQTVANQQLQQQLDAAQHTVARLQQSVALLNQAQDDTERLRIERDIRTRRQLLGLLSRDQLVSYASTLDDLARVPWQQLSLTSLQLQGQAMTLTGEAATAAAVPAWILGFEHYQSLARREFGKLDIHQNGTEALEFSLHSDGVAR